MAFLWDLLLAFIVLLGHAAMCVAFVNRSQAIDWPYNRLKVLKKLTLAFTAAIPLLYLAKWIVQGACVLPPSGELFDLLRSPWGYYPALCLFAFLVAIPYWLLPKLFDEMPLQLRKRKFTIVNLAKTLPEIPLHGPKIGFAKRIPGNQILDVAIEQKTLAIAQLPEELAGLRIAHLSDLHMTGMYTPEFYQWVVEETNRLSPDVIFITGDIVDYAHCLPWVTPTFRPLQAALGKYYVLGNHDRRLPDVSLLRSALHEADIVNMAGQVLTLETRGRKIVLAGNELPWFGPAPSVPGPEEEKSLRILLTHTPDNFSWARENRFDLVLAGHNHGGQIRFPWLGALISPSLYGTRYAGGLYYDFPTLLHVSRGLAGVDPIRLNCRPEIALLELVPE